VPYVYVGEVYLLISSFCEARQALFSAGRRENE